jgi:hypothetical protein
MLSSFSCRDLKPENILLDDYGKSGSGSKPFSDEAELSIMSHSEQRDSAGMERLALGPQEHRGSWGRGPHSTPHSRALEQVVE